MTIPEIEMPSSASAKKVDNIEKTMNVITEHFEGRSPDQIPNDPHKMNGTADHIPVPM